jgi:cation-transporting ATPase F
MDISMNSLLGKHWHHLPTDEVLDLLETNIQQGLDIFEIKHGQDRFGFNVLKPNKGKSPLVSFLLHFNYQLHLVIHLPEMLTIPLQHRPQRFCQP